MGKNSKPMRRLCIRCMGSPCQCLPEDDSTALYIYKHGLLETKKAFSVVLAKQTLDNGVEIKSGTRVWIPSLVSESRIVNSGTKCLVPNWKINELIKMFNVKKLKSAISIAD